MPFRFLAGELKQETPPGLRRRGFGIDALIQTLRRNADDHHHTHDDHRGW